MADNFYERHILPHVLNLACGVPPVARQRKQLIPLAEGDVLEIGIGTGLNMPFYDASRVHRIVGVDPSLQMHRLAQQRVEASGLTVELVALSAERLPVDDASFDTVVCTYTLCSIPDPNAALAEIRRVLRPNGRFLFSEHGVAPDASVRRWQRRLQPVWTPISGGCCLNVNVPQLLQDAGFKVDIQSGYLPGPKFVNYHYWGVATLDS